MKPTTMDELEHQHLLEIQELNHEIWILRDSLKEILESSSLPMAKAWAETALYGNYVSRYVDDLDG